MFVNKLQLAKIENPTVIVPYYIYVQNRFCIKVVDCLLLVQTNFVAGLGDGAKFCLVQDTIRVCHSSPPYLRLNTP